MWRDGALLVVKKGEKFPDRCVKSNQPARGRRVRQEAAVGSAFPLLLLLHFVNPVAGFLAAAFSGERTIAFKVGLGDKWHRKRRRAFWVAGGIIIASLAAFGYGVNFMGGELAIWLIPVGLLTTVGGLFYGLNASTLVVARRITKDYVWLSGVHPDFLADLPNWPGELWADVSGFPDGGE
jgi:hypothetical protein